PPAGALEEPRQKEIERAQAATLRLLVQRLDPDADSGRERARSQTGSRLFRRRTGEAVLFIVRAPAETILEIDAEVFHGLVRELSHDPGVNPRREPVIELEDLCQRRRVRRGLLKDIESCRAELPCRVRSEEVRAAVHGVHRLPSRPLTWKARRD